MPRVWTKHGSTRYLYDRGSFQQKVRYVVYEQGKMADYYIDGSLEWLRDVNPVACASGLLSIPESSKCKQGIRNIERKR